MRGGIGARARSGKDARSGSLAREYVKRDGVVEFGETPAGVQRLRETLPLSEGIVRSETPVTAGHRTEGCLADGRTTGVQALARACHGGTPPTGTQVPVGCNGMLGATVPLERD